MATSIRSIMSTSLFGWVIIACASLIYLFTISNGRLSLRDDRVKFGIDLVGGTYITLEVDTQKALELELLSRKQAILQAIKDNNYAMPKSSTVTAHDIQFIFDSTQAVNQVFSALSQFDHTLLFSVDGAVLKVKLKENAVQHIKEWAVQSNIEVLRSRIDKIGVGEISIAAQGENNIVVELPNVDDPQKAKAMIGKAALLEIKLIERIADDQEKLLEDFDGELPDDMIILPGAEVVNGKKLYFLVPKYTDLTGRLLKDAFADLGGEFRTEYVVNFEFNPEGADKFYELTRNNNNRQVAIILDNTVISFPKITVPIRERGFIHGSFTQESSKELALLLKSGAFVAPVKFAQERRIGPSLGQESINNGLLACLIGMVALLIFSIIMYRLAGFFAFITLMYNLLFILVALSWLRATLTLPGIAGMVLTVGMAIDASILIYERIREELARGVPLGKAIDEGFSDAMAVILDSNITTFIVGIVLYYFGTGPIQGFAITMMIGIIATLVTGLFFLRSLFSALLTFSRVHQLRI